MEPTIIGSWSKRTARAVARSSSDEETHPQKRLKKHRGSSLEPSSGVEEDEHHKKYTSDLLSIRDIVEELQSKERSFHRSQQAQYETLKRTIVDMESRWTREKYKRKMAGGKQQQRRLEELISRQNEQAKDDLTRQGMVARETLTPAVNRTAISCLPTPGETVRRPNMGVSSPAPDRHLEEDLIMELFQQDLTIEPFKSEDDSDHPPSTAWRNGKQPIRLTLSTPNPEARPSPQSPQRYDTKWLRAAQTTLIEINSSDGDDEDDIADDTGSVRADERAASASDYGGIVWPPGVGIGQESDEIDMKDEHPSAADTPFPEPDLMLSPSTVCADRIVPVGPGPFRLTPSYRFRPPILGHKSFLWRPASGSVLGKPGPSNDRGVDWRVEKGGKTTSTTMAVIPTTVAGSSTDEPGSAGIATKKKKIKLNLNKMPVVPRPRVPSVTLSILKKEERDPQRLVINGELISLSDDSDDDMDVDVNIGIPARFRAQPSPQPPPQQPNGLRTRESVQALGIPPPATNIPEVMLRFSRAHIQKAFGGKPRGTVTIVKPNVGRIFHVEQFLCINEKLNPYYPSRAGMHGAMFIFRTGAVPLNTEWAVFCSRRRIGPGPQETFEYAGNYIVRDVNDMPYDEWAGSSVKFKDGWAGHVAHQARSPKGWASQNLASRRLVRSADGITAEQVRGWFDAAAVSSVQRNEWFGLTDVYKPAQAGRHPHAHLGRRVLEFKEYKSGIYNSLVRVKQQNW